LSRVTPELIAAARSIPADLYIGHNLGALPAAIAGAQKHSGRAGFDAEDFYSAMVPLEQRSPDDILAEQVESRYLPYCDFVSAASPEMSRAYAVKYGIPEPNPILNVFPLAHRPLAFRPSDRSGPLKLYWFSQTIGCGRGLEDVIQAMGLIGARDIQLYLQGQWSPGYEESLLACMKQNRVDRRQVIHLPPEYPDAIVRRASTCDVGLALDHSDSRNRDLTLSNKIFTYILAGNAVAATATSGQKPVVERITPAAAAYTPRDAAGLAGILEEWYRNTAELDAARRTAWDWGTREYNWDLEQKKFLRQVSGLSRQPHAVEMLQ
jgi:hypothetical protein